LQHAKALLSLTRAPARQNKAASAQHPQHQQQALQQGSSQELQPLQQYASTSCTPTTLLTPVAAPKNALDFYN
jgi:hypothetical protein